MFDATLLGNLSADDAYEIGGRVLDAWLQSPTGIEWLKTEEDEYHAWLATPEGRECAREMAEADRAAFERLLDAA